MELKTVRGSVRALLVAVAIVMPVGQALASNCDEASQAWAKQNLPRLPSNVQEFSAVPGEHSRTVFRMLTPEVRSQLWRGQFTNYLKANPGLSKEQKQAIQDAIALASPQLFRAAEGSSAHLNVDVHSTLEALHARFTILFGEDETRHLLASLGKVDGGVASFSMQCSCSDYSSYCSSDYHCAYGGCDTTGGCGTFWSYACDGTCQSKPPSGPTGPSKPPAP